MQQIERKFIYDKKELKDIEALNVQEILTHYSREYPELLNAKILDKPVKDGVKIYEFKVANGTKG